MNEIELLEVSVSDLSIQIKHLKSVPNVEDDKIATAVVRCLRTNHVMQSIGAISLLIDGSANCDLVEFLNLKK